ncbi:hypothetical protein [Nesterenkonia sp. PF2B19]|uniref:hypothetical protein n=1 Tax=Nesterenkonia sp. PF2B19 TaxID=1881858 RepID=UPI0009F636F9|nr:hypothetical protein [Nesterenkonia sp. PF2B19]OSM44562.1 hypothetical protein BCY76_001265 [Nesterenkonia sp. PF2B19]
MNTSTERDRQHQEQPLDRRPQRPAQPETDRTTVEPTEKSGTPEAVRVAKIGQDQKTPKIRGHRAPGVDWVRPTDLMARHSAALAGRGIDFEVELARRSRAPVAAGMRSVSDRARRLPPVSAFGRGGTARAPARPAVGMS